MFEPKGDLPRWQVVYNAISHRPNDVVIPYREMPFSIEILRGLRDRVAKAFEREQKRTVVCVRDEGWVIRRGIQQVDVASKTRRSATRKMGRALQIAQTADRREMSGEERLRADAELLRVNTAYGVARGLASKKVGLDDVQRWLDEKGGNAA